MDVFDIIYRKDGTEITQEEMIFVINEYIREKKGKVVYINIMKDLDRKSPLFTVMYNRQLNLMRKAFIRAQSYFTKNKK